MSERIIGHQTCTFCKGSGKRHGWKCEVCSGSGKMPIYEKKPEPREARIGASQNGRPASNADLGHDPERGPLDISPILL